MLDKISLSLGITPHYAKQQSEKMKLIWAKRKEGLVNGD